MDHIKNYRPLINAYAGYHEDKFKHFTPDQRPDAIRAVIDGDTPHERLRVYCEWEGIVGFNDILYKIATSEPAKVE